MFLVAEYPLQACSLPGVFSCRTVCNTVGCGPKYTTDLDVLDNALTREYWTL